MEIDIPDPSQLFYLHIKEEKIKKMKETVLVSLGGNRGKKRPEQRGFGALGKRNTCVVMKRSSKHGYSIILADGQTD